MLNKIRWKIFMLLSWVGWKICPEPQRSNVWHHWQAESIVRSVFERGGR